jgi:hypothetical protein
MGARQRGKRGTNLVQGVADDFNVQLIKVLPRDAVDKVGCCAKISNGGCWKPSVVSQEEKKVKQLQRAGGARKALTKRGVDEDRVVELLGCVGDGQRPHLGKDAERVALGQQL